MHGNSDDDELYSKAQVYVMVVYYKYYYYL